MEHGASSAAQAFFMANKDLFEYEKHVGRQTPFQPQSTNDQEEAGVTKSFLEQYRALDRNRQSEPTLSELSFSLAHPLKSRHSLPNLAVPSPAPEFFSLQSTTAFANSFGSSQHLQNEYYSCIASPQRPVHQKQQFFQPSTLAIMHDDSTPQHPSALMTLPNGHQTSNPLGSPQRYRSPVRQSVEMQHFSMPKLAELLIDQETRANVISHKSLDEAHKIEVLIGDKCVGRVSAASRNIPPSIRMRLHASANVSARRDKLYELLRRDYEELSTRYIE